MTRATSLAITTVVLAASVAGCVKPTDYDPAARPDESELNRLQEIVNARPSLENAREAAATIEMAVRRSLSAHAPREALPQSPDPTVPPLKPGEVECWEPFNHSVGRAYKSATFVGGALTAEQWRKVGADVEPLLEKSGFTVNPDYAEPPDGLPNLAQRRDDDVVLNLVARDTDGRLMFNYRIGCHLPEAWRGGPPPEGFDSRQGPGAHYPYLYGDGRVDYQYSPGGSVVETPTR